MPNHVTNRIIARWNEKDIDEYENQVITEFDDWCKNFDFNKLIPMPNNIYKWDLGQEERKKYWEDNWYDWSIKNWWTKRPAYEFYMKRRDWIMKMFNERKSEIIFNTAWGTPLPIWYKLWEIFKNIKFKIEFADEDIWNNCWINNIENWELTWINKNSKYNFAKRVQSYNKFERFNNFTY